MSNKSLIRTALREGDSATIGEVLSTVGPERFAELVAATVPPKKPQWRVLHRAPKNQPIIAWSRSGVEFHGVQWDTQSRAFGANHSGVFPEFVCWREVQKSDPPTRDQIRRWSVSGK